MKFLEIYTKIGVFVFSAFDEKTGLTRVICRHRIATGQTDFSLMEASTEFARLLLKHSFIWDFNTEKLLSVGTFSRHEGFFGQILKTCKRQPATLPTFYHLPTNEDHAETYQEHFRVFPILPAEERDREKKSYFERFLLEYKYVTHFYLWDDSFVTYTREGLCFLDLIHDCAVQASLPLHLVEEQKDLPVW